MNSTCKYIPEGNYKIYNGKIIFCFLFKETATSSVEKKHWALLTAHSHYPLITAALLFSCVLSTGPMDPILLWILYFPSRQFAYQNSSQWQEPEFFRLGQLMPVSTAFRRWGQGDQECKVPLSYDGSSRRQSVLRSCLNRQTNQPTNRRTRILECFDFMT